METVTRYQQSRRIMTPYRAASLLTKVTEYFLPKEKIIFCTDGIDTLITEDTDAPRLLAVVDNTGRSHAAENVEEVQMAEATYATVVEWHRVKRREQELRERLEKDFLYDQGDF
jgi:hypothetical protein